MILIRKRLVVRDRDLVHQRAELYGHDHTTRRQANLPPVSSDLKYNSKRGGVTADIADPFVRCRVEADLALLEPLDLTIRHLKADVEDAAKEHYLTELTVLQSTVMKELPQPRPTHVMIRGNFRNLGDEVKPGAPATLHPLPERRRPTALGWPGGS